MSRFKKANWSERSAPMPTVRRKYDTGSGDWFPTPAWATRALLKQELMIGPVIEPACGDGSMAKVLEEEGYRVHASDLYDRGYGKTGVDFLTMEGPFPNVVTNPPYSLAGDFVAHATDRTSGLVCMFLRLAFLEGVERYYKIFSDNPPNRVWIFPNRVTLFPANYVPEPGKSKSGGTTAYAWFVWDNRETVPYGGPYLKWFPPTAKNSK